MEASPLAPRLRRLPATVALGREVRLARGPRARLLGLAFLDREAAGAGLLIPRCSSVHTFGMRFPLDLLFLDERGAVLAVRRAVPPRRFASHPCATAVLEIPGRRGGLPGPVADLVGERRQGADAGLQGVCQP